MQEPVLRDMPVGHAGLKDAVALLLFLGEDGAFFVEDIDEPLQHLHQCRACAQAQARRDEAGVGLIVARAIAQDADDRKADVVGGDFGFGKQLQILAADLDRLFVQARVVIRPGLIGAEIADRGGCCFEGRSLAVALRPGHGLVHGQMVGYRRVERGKVAWVGCLVRAGKIKGQAVFKEPARVRQRQRTVAQGVHVELQTGEAEGIAPEGLGDEVQRVFKVTALDLKVVRAQIHAF